MCRTVTIMEHERGLDYRRGRLAGVLEPGVYTVWSSSRRKIEKVDIRETALQVTGQELLTADRAAVRLNLVVRYRLADPAQAARTVQSASDALYQLTQLAAREAVASRELDSLLNERAALNDALTKAVAERAAEFGVEVSLVALKDIGLDGQLKSAYQEKLTADQQGQAKLVRARHDVAVARAQANAAQLLADNPALLAHQQLEVLKKAAEGGYGNHFVVLPEGLGGLLKKLAGE